MIKSLELALVDAWYQAKPQLSLLRPLSMAFGCLVALRRRWYKSRPVQAMPVPVIVVGNISVGGSGKTPVVIALAQALQAEGFKPGVISRGYGAKTNTKPRSVTTDSLAMEVGDEPLLIHLQTKMPVMVGAHRVASAQALLKAHPEINVILSDDGLQHYRLPRFKEIVMVDDASLGNSRLLPEGPLREPLARLKEVDYRLGAGKHADYHVLYQMDQYYSLHSPDTLLELTSLANQEVHAVAAIARPERFFNALRAHNIKVIEHRFPDHYPLAAQDFKWDDGKPILMTEKDAVKCTALPIPVGVVCLKAILPEPFVESLVKDLYHGQKTA